jgi:hypothetical protein
VTDVNRFITYIPKARPDSVVDYAKVISNSRGYGELRGIIKTNKNRWHDPKSSVGMATT